ncbi:DUF6039 family protein [Streptomyces sp. NPDC096094]|uniref:DUF6039 family protein n=1 Tax=Streptomyces sp. NPDC096094 TaxID=3366073 RepID=UPI00382455ED
MADAINAKQGGEVSVLLYEEAFGTSDRIHWLIHMKSLASYYSLIDMRAWMEDDVRDVYSKERIAPENARGELPLGQSACSRDHPLSSVSDRSPGSSCSGCGSPAPQTEQHRTYARRDREEEVETVRHRLPAADSNGGGQPEGDHAPEGCSHECGRQQRPGEDRTEDPIAAGEYREGCHFPSEAQKLGKCSEANGYHCQAGTDQSEQPYP